MGGRRALLILLAVGLAACDADGDGDGVIAEIFDNRHEDPIVLEDANNFFYTGWIDAPSTPAAALSDLRFDWSGLAEDIQCHDLDPVGDIDNVGLMVFPYLDEEAVEYGLSTDTLLQSDMGVYLSVEPGDSTAVDLSEFTFFGTEANIQNEFDVDSGTWMLLLTTGDTVGVGSRMLSFFEPDASSDNTEISISDGCSVLDFDVDLSSLTPTTVYNKGPWRIDWSGVTINGQGNDMKLGNIDGLMLSRFDLSIAELESQFLDLQLIAAESWEMPISGAYAAELEGLEGFTGFDTESTWLFALFCSTCPNPAPLFLTQLVLEE